MSLRVVFYSTKNPWIRNGLFNQSHKVFQAPFLQIEKL